MGERREHALGFINVDVDIVFATLADRHLVEAVLARQHVSAFSAGIAATWQLDDPALRTQDAVFARLLDIFEQVPPAAAAALSRASLVFDVGHDAVEHRQSVTVSPAIVTRPSAALGGALAVTTYTRSS